METAKQTHEHGSETGYSGWKNYETWCVNLWLDNDQGTHEYKLELAAQAKDRSAEIHGNVLSGIWQGDRAIVYLLADSLKTWVTEELLPDLGCTMAADLLGAALSEVDWQEIAEAALEA